MKPLRLYKSRPGGLLSRKSSNRMVLDVSDNPGPSGKHPRSDCCRHRTPVPLQRWHFMTLSPFLTSPLPSQFLHFCFFLMLGPLSFDIGFTEMRGWQSLECGYTLRCVIPYRLSKNTSLRSFHA